MGLNRESKNTSSPTSLVKVVLGLVATGLLVWGLITFTLPKNKLEPYNKFKKTAATLESTKNEKPLSSDIKSEKSSTKTQLTESTKNLKDKEEPKTPEKPFEDPKSKTAISPEALQFISKGMELTEKGKYELADVQFEKAAELSPNSPEVYSIWGASLRMQKKFKGANKRFEKALQLAPNDSEITFNWGLSRLHEKKSDEAIKLFKKTVELDPKHYLAYNYLGKSYGLKKDFKNEEANYVKALKIKDDFAQGHFNLGIVRSLQKKFEKAAPHFQKAIELDKQYEKPFVVQFLTAMGLKNPGKGMKKAPLKPSPKKSDKQKETTTAKLDEKTKKEEGSDHKQEGSDGSAAKIVNPITNIKGTATINGQPVDSRGVIYLETTNKLKVPDQTSQKIKIFQRNMQFVPNNSVVMVGSTITFINDDREVHNIYSKSLNNQFNLGAMAAGTGKEIRLSQPGPVILRCNMHKDMLGTLFVAPNGYFAQTNEKGEFHFDKVKSQEYIMTLWHPRLFPEEVQKHAKGVSLTGVDQTLDIAIESISKPDEVHDLVDETDYNLVVDNIEEEVSKAIRAWKDGKKYLSRKRMLIAITKYYDGAGLKGAISKSFSEKRSELIESQLDSIRKQISGLNKKQNPSEESLKFEADRVIAQLRNNVQELKNRLNPTP